MTEYLLDTNLVIQSWRYTVGNECFDGDRVELLYTKGQERLADDLFALHHLFVPVERGYPIFRVAPATLRELAESDEEDADSIITWGEELADYQAPSDWSRERISTYQSEILHPHARGVDSILLVEAARLGCDA